MSEHVYKARAEKERRRREEHRANQTLAEFIAETSPSFDQPLHLSPLLDVLEKVHRGDVVRACFSVPPRHAKAIADDTSMWTPSGWRRADEIEEGDQLFGRDGQRTKVIGVYPQGEVDLWRVTFSDGASLVTCADHRWSVEQRYGGPSRIKTTGELVGDVAETDGRKKWRIPVAEPLFGRSQLLLDPYLLGCWLGDGSSRSGEITTMDREIVDAFRDAGFQTSYEYKTSKATTYGVRELCSRLKRLNVYGRKHIPRAYLLAEEKDRLAVVQGLCDTDGTVAKNGSTQSFTTTNEALSDGFKFLINSLGGTWSDYTRQAAKKIAHTIRFQLPGHLSAFRLQRKSKRLSKRTEKNKPKRLISSIERAGRGLARCFEVDAADHLYLAGRHLVVTHNTESILHAGAKLLRDKTTKTIGYVSYAAQFAESKSRRARDIARAAGCKVDRNTAAAKEWRLEKDRGGMLATGVDGPLTGHGVDFLIVDDPHKNRIEAESRLKRDRIEDWFQSVAYERLEPGGSIVVVHTRWHEDDLIGRLVNRGWDWINLPALTDDGVALWPERFTAKHLEDIRKQIGDYEWSSQYMGNPRPRSASLFEDVVTYKELPSDGVMWSIGVDLAYSSKTKSDYNVIVVMAMHQEITYVVDVRRVQCRSDQIKPVLEMMRREFPAAGVPRFMGSGVESGTADLLGLEWVPAVGDKWVRAQSFAAAWNAGEVMVPETGSWVTDYVDELRSFSGDGSGHDDQVDASVAAFDALLGSGFAFV